MARIISATEGYQNYHQIMSLDHDDIYDTVPHAVAKSATNLAYNVRAKAIIVFTATGTTAIRVSRERPRTPAIAFVPDRKVAGRVALYWGFQPIIEPESFDMEGMQDAVSDRLVEMGIAKDGDPVVIVAGFPFGQPGSTNLIRVHNIGG
ncbi:MAG: pyruvate kinase alpha/beta domain-containing protein [Pseudomonadota bacterium]